MTIAIGTILQRPLLNATASDIARVFRQGMKNAGIKALDADTFSSGKKLIEVSSRKPGRRIFTKKGKLGPGGKAIFTDLLEKLGLPTNTKISEVENTLAKRGTHLWDL